MSTYDDALGAARAVCDATDAKVRNLEVQASADAATIAALKDRIDELENPPTQKYGVSASPSPFDEGYAQQVADLNANCCYRYGDSPTWSDVSSVPDDHDIWLQTKAESKDDYVAMLRTFPATREGKVYLHYRNEPEKKIQNGLFSMATWRQRTDWLFEAIAGSGLDYVVPSVELMSWTLTLTLNGKYADEVEFPDGCRYLPNYIRPGLQQIGWSVYSQREVRDGHEVATISPVDMPAKIRDYHAANFPDITWSTITGWGIGDAYVNDEVSIDNRVAWMLEAAHNLRDAGSEHFMWFDTNWPSGDYRIMSDPVLLEAWKTLLTDEGQTRPGTR